MNGAASMTTALPYLKQFDLSGQVALVTGSARGLGLCIARALTTADEWIATHTIADWKKQPAPQLDKMPTLFLYLAR